MEYEIKNLLPRDNHLIRNKYHITNPTTDDFHLVIYYLDIDRIKIIIRKMNNNDGWNCDLIIKIFTLNDYNNKYEIISIGSNITNTKIINYNLTIDVEKKTYYKQNISKTIIQTNKSRFINDKALYESILTFIELNPEYEYKFFDNIECRNFIRDYFDKEILDYYDRLIPGAFQADLFRYCYLYINGGCYFDCKNILKMSLSDLLKEDDDLILCQDIDDDCYYNSIIMASPRNMIFMKAINFITNNIDNFEVLYDLYKKKVTSKKPYYGTLNITGPNLLYISAQGSIDKEKSVRLLHYIDGNYKNYRNLKITYKNQIFAYKSYYSWKESNNHYNRLWVKKEILYDEITFNERKILIYPNYNIKYRIIDDKIIIKKIVNKINDFIKFKIVINDLVIFKKYDTNRREIDLYEILNNK